MSKRYSLNGGESTYQPKGYCLACACLSRLPDGDHCQECLNPAPEEEEEGRDSDRCAICHAGEEGCQC